METQYSPLLKEACIFIKEIGFPVFVALWVLLITSRDTRRLTGAINSLTRSFDRANIKTEPNDKF